MDCKAVLKSVMLTQIFFEVTTGVCQGCIFSPTLFNIDIDYLMGILERQVKAGVKLDKAIFQDLEYANGIGF